MGTKAQLIEFILAKFEEPNGNSVSKSKLDALRKADLEELITQRNLVDAFQDWISNS